MQKSERYVITEKFTQPIFNMKIVNICYDEILQYIEFLFARPKLSILSNF